MREFVVGEESFCQRFLERVPEPEEGQCYLLYQEGAGSEKSRVISHGIQYSSSGVRRGHYNKKVTFSLQKKGFLQKDKVAASIADFGFNVDVSVTYELQDVQKYFFGEPMDEDSIRYNVKKCISRQNGRWEIKQGWELRRELEDDIERELKRFKGIRFQVMIEVKLEEAAERMLKSDQNKVVDIHISDNEKDVQIAANEHMAAIIKSERELKIQQIQSMGILLEKFGALGPVADEYLKGKIGGKEFYGYIMKAKTDNMNMLKLAVDNDLLTSDEVMSKIGDILTNERFEKVEQQLPDKNRGNLEDRGGKQAEAADVDEYEETDAPAEDGFV